MTKEKELYEKLYPPKKVVDNPFVTAEAVGYLKHLKITNPEQVAWIDPLILMLLTHIAVKFAPLKE